MEHRGLFTFVSATLQCNSSTSLLQNDILNRWQHGDENLILTFDFK